MENLNTYVMPMILAENCKVTENDDCMIADNNKGKHNIQASSISKKTLAKQSIVQGWLYSIRPKPAIIFRKKTVKIIKSIRYNTSH